MATEQTQRYCPSCQRNVMATRAGTNHILHLLLTVFTAGCWLLVWVLSSIRFGGWRCTFCGSQRTESPK
jgi:hypothetical protein